MTSRRERRRHLPDHEAMLGVIEKVAEGGEQIDREGKAAVAKRQRPHVPPYQPRARALAGSAQHRARPVEPDDVPAQAIQLCGVSSRPAGEVQDAITGPPGDDAPNQGHGGTCVLIIAMWIEGMVLLAEPLLEPFSHSTKTSAVNVNTRVAGSRQLPGGSPALWHTAFRNASGPNPCSTATCGNSTACARPRRTSRPSRPITKRHRSDVSTSTGSSSTEISIRNADSSSSRTGGNRGSERAAETATFRMISPSGRSPRMWPMQPRRSCASCSSSVTNAPRRNRAPGTSGSRGGGHPVRAAWMALRARASSAARSAGVRQGSGSAMILLSAADRVRTIQLLVQDHARELVRQGQRPQAPAAFGAVEHVLRKAVRVADHERDVAALHLPATDELGELGRAPALTTLGQRDHPRILGYARPCHFEFLDLGVVPDPAQVVVTGRQ